MLAAAAPGDDRAARMQRAYAGQFTTGGATSPQEAIAFAGAFAQVYKKTQRPISQNAQLAAATFLSIAAIPDDAKAAQLAMQFGASSLLDKVKAGIAGPFSKLGGVVPGTSRALAVDVLQHAASVYAAAGEAALAAAMIRAAGADKGLAQDLLVNLTDTARDLATGAAAVVGNPVAAAERVLDAAAGKALDTAQDIGTAASRELHEGIAAIVGPAQAILAKGERLMDDAAALPKKLEDAATKAATGALNMGSSALDTLVGQSKAILAALEKRAQALADMGEGAVKDQLAYVRGLADKFKSMIDKIKAAPGKFTDAVKAQMDALRTRIEGAWQTLTETVAAVKKSADEGVARLGEEFSSGLAQVMETGRKAAEATQRMAETAYTALGAKVDAASSALSEGAKKVMAVQSSVGEGLANFTKILQALALGLVVILLIVIVK